MRARCLLRSPCACARRAACASCVSQGAGDVFASKANNKQTPFFLHHSSVISFAHSYPRRCQDISRACKERDTVVSQRRYRQHSETPADCAPSARSRGAPSRGMSPAAAFATAPLPACLAPSASDATGEAAHRRRARAQAPRKSSPTLFPASLTWGECSAGDHAIRGGGSGIMLYPSPAVQVEMGAGWQHLRRRRANALRARICRRRRRQCRRRCVGAAWPPRCCLLLPASL